MNDILLSEYQALLRHDLTAFFEKSFSWLHPTQPYHENWHVEAICHRTSQVTKQKGFRLLVLLPPRFLKSTIVSVALPAYLLGRDPTMRIINVSYSQDLANKFSNDCRSIINSPWYQAIFPKTTISPSKDSQSLFETTAHGSRMATSVQGTLTGFGADVLIIDDPMKAQDATSEAARKSIKEWFDGTAVTRLNDPKNSSIIVVMQRLHQGDLAGHLLEKGGWDILKIKLTAEENETFDLGGGRQHCRIVGELLHPERFGELEVASARKDLGTAGFYAQYQQAPIPPSGHVFDWGWFNTYEVFPEVSELVLSVDVAATESGGNYSAFTLWGHLDGNWYLRAIWRFQYELPKVRKTIMQLDQSFRPDLIVIDGNGIGKALVQELRAQNFNHILSASGKGKEPSALSVVPFIEGGRVFVPISTPGLQEFREEVIAFPNGKYCDQVDSMVQALFYRQRIIVRAQACKKPERKRVKSKPTLSCTISLIGKSGWTRQVINP